MKHIIKIGAMEIENLETKCNRAYGDIKIGGDKGDLKIGYAVSDGFCVTLQNVFLITSIENLTKLEAIEIATEIINESYDSIRSDVFVGKIRWT